MSATRSSQRAMSEDEMMPRSSQSRATSTRRTSDSCILSSTRTIGVSGSTSTSSARGIMTSAATSSFHFSRGTSCRPFSVTMPTTTSSWTTGNAL
ncbi:MAG: hypothetical protein EA350_03530 [Gemmatimonadales bacterium]|nr:MAG: hypothetical protein EA350_03530 [Gemmatimonadales bacterium]